MPESAASVNKLWALLAEMAQLWRSFMLLHSLFPAIAEWSTSLPLLDNIEVARGKTDEETNASL